jgi:hypothetical protein
MGTVLVLLSVNEIKGIGFKVNPKKQVGYNLRLESTANFVDFSAWAKRIG